MRVALWAASTVAFAAAAAPQVLPGALIQKQIDDAVAAGAPTVRLRPGTYQFTEPLEIKGARDLAVLGAGVELRFRVRPGNATAPPLSTGFRLIDTTNVSISGTKGDPLVIDYDPAPYWQGIIARLAPRVPDMSPELFLKPDVGFPSLTDWWPTFQAAAIKVAVMWDPATRLMSLEAPDGVHTWEFNPGSVTAADPEACGGSSQSCSRVQDWSFDWQWPNAGTLLTVAANTGYTLNIANSTAARVSDVSIYAASNKAITEFDGEGGHVYERVFIGRRPGGNGLLAANSDAFHSAGVRRGPTLLDCEFSFSGDDFFNVHSTMQIVLDAREEAGAAPTLTVIEPLLGPADLALYGPNTVYGTAVQFENTVPGSSLSLFRPSDVGLVGSVVAAGSPVRVTDPSVIARAANISAVLASRGLPVAAGMAVRVWDVAVDAVPRAVLEAPAGTLLNMDDWDARGASIQGCFFHDGYCTAGRIKSPGATIVRNRFERAVIHTVYLSPSPPWLEGPMRAPNMTFSRNNLTACGLTPFRIVPGWTQGLVMEDNLVS